MYELLDCFEDLKEEEIKAIALKVEEEIEYEDRAGVTQMTLQEMAD